MKSLGKVLLFFLPLNLIFVLLLIFGVQLLLEDYYLRLSRVEKINSGRLYNLISQTSRECGLKKTPELYVSHNFPFNAFYLQNSIKPFGMRSGIILISEEFADLFSDEEIGAVFAHEIGHLKTNDRWQFSTNRSIELEIAADRLGAGCVGTDAMVNLRKKSTYLMIVNPENLPLTPEQKKKLRELQRNIGATRIQENQVRILVLQKQ